MLKLWFWHRRVARASEPGHDGLARAADRIYVRRSGAFRFSGRPLFIGGARERVGRVFRDFRRRRLETFLLNLYRRKTLKCYSNVDTETATKTMYRRRWGHGEPQKGTKSIGFYWGGRVRILTLQDRWAGVKFIQLWSSDFNIVKTRLNSTTSVVVFCGKHNFILFFCCSYFVLT